MKIRCKYCREYISDTDEKCPNCGGVNDKYIKFEEYIPKTIAEFIKWYNASNLPDEKVTRFFIGKDNQEKRAFGIYKDEDSENYVVYKNKDDGSRTIRYEGKDEQYAVKELYLRLKEEIQNQKANIKNKKNHNSIISKIAIVHSFAAIIAYIISSFAKGRFEIASFFLYFTWVVGLFFYFFSDILIKNKKILSILDKIWHYGSFVIYFLILIVPGIITLNLHKNDAYYRYNDSIYYLYGNSWYIYDNSINNWLYYDGQTDDFNILGQEYNPSYAVSDFTSSMYYDSEDVSFWGKKDAYSSNTNDSSDWGSDSSWDSSDSWDSGSTDWSSDW